MRYVVGIGSPRREETAGVAPLLPRRIKKDFLKAGFAVAADDEHILQLRQVGPDVGHHGRVIEAAKGARDDEYLAFRKAKHEGQFALAKNRHQWIGHGADPYASQMQRGELPPVRQLAGNNIAFLHAEFREADRDTFDNLAEIAVAEAGGLIRHGVEVDDGRLVRHFGDATVEVAGGRLAGPEAAGVHRLDTLPGQNWIEHR